MSTITICSGKDKGGEDCRCSSFIQRASKKPNKPVKCRDCRHTESCHTVAHPATVSVSQPAPVANTTATETVPPTIAAILSRYSTMGRPKPMVSEAEARIEMRRGLRGSPDTENDSGTKRQQKVHLIEWQLYVPNHELCFIIEAYCKAIIKTT
jgi:hypothetical protein